MKQGVYNEDGFIRAKKSALPVLFFGQLISHY